MEGIEADLIPKHGADGQTGDDQTRVTGVRQNDGGTLKGTEDAVAALYVEGRERAGAQGAGAQGRDGARPELRRGGIELGVDGEGTHRDGIEIQIVGPILISIRTDRKDVSIVDKGAIGIVGDDLADHEIVEVS